MNNSVFMDRLGVARSDAEFVRTAAGLATLQAYDSIKTHGFDPFVHETVLDRIAKDVQSITDDSEIADALGSVIQALPFWEGSHASSRIGRRAVYTSLLVYGQALSDDGEWGLAEQVYALVGMDTELDGATWLAAEARLLMGRACRMCADWETSRMAYRRAYQLGIEARDFAIALRARIGEANNLWGRGDFPAANRLLATTLRRARVACPSVAPRVMLAMAGVANAAGNHERAIQLAFTLQDSLTDDDELKYQTLVDLAIFFTDYGLPPIAESALRLVEHSAPELRVRRHATLNLFFLAAHYQSEAAFKSLNDKLANELLTPRQQTQFALFAAQGYRRFSQFDSARASAEHALALAKQHEFFQLVFETETELHEIDADRTASAATLAPTSVPPTRKRVEKTLYRSTTGARPSARIQRVAESLENMARQLVAPDAV
ncbi:MAG: hypothetical protein ABI311_00960 [Gemmatimonadaceae bacterium]